MDEVPLIAVDSISSLSDTVFALIRKNSELKKRIVELETRLEISRKLQEKPRLYSPNSDPYFNQENEDGC